VVGGLLAGGGVLVGRNLWEMVGGAYLGWGLCFFFVWAAVKPYKTQAIGGVLVKQAGQAAYWSSAEPGPWTPSLRAASF
jgi:hypothetical protein